MKREDIRVGLGLKVMSRYNKITNQKLSAIGCGNLLNKFFRGCKTTTKMQERIKLNGGYDSSADILAQHLNDDGITKWKTK